MFWGREVLLEEIYDRRCADEVAPNKWSGLTDEERYAIIAEKRARVKTDKDGKVIDEFAGLRLPRRPEELVADRDMLVGRPLSASPPTCWAPYGRRRSRAAFIPS